VTGNVTVTAQYRANTSADITTTTDDDTDEGAATTTTGDDTDETTPVADAVNEPQLSGTETLTGELENGETSGGGTEPGGADASDGTDGTVIDDSAAPLASGADGTDGMVAGGGAWSLLDVLSAIIATLSAIFSLFVLITRRMRERGEMVADGYDELGLGRSTRLLMTLVSLGAAIAAVIVFALTQTVGGGTMTFADGWSPLLLALAIIGVVSAVLTPRKAGMAAGK
jgi:hypothetical protein